MEVRTAACVLASLVARAGAKRNAPDAHENACSGRLAPCLAADRRAGVSSPGAVCDVASAAAHAASWRLCRLAVLRCPADAQAVSVPGLAAPRHPRDAARGPARRPSRARDRAAARCRVRHARGAAAGIRPLRGDAARRRRRAVGLVVAPRLRTDQCDLADGLRHRWARSRRRSRADYVAAASSRSIS